jgi:hypothetical protein
MNWAASSAPSAADVRHVVLGNLAAMVISLVIALVRQLTSGTAQPTGWGQRGDLPGLYRAVRVLVLLSCVGTCP